MNLSTVVWLILTVATAVSWWLGTGHGVAGQSHSALIILVLAFLKVRLVIRHFMEVRHAPLTLRLITDTWVLVVCSVVVAMYLFPWAPPAGLDLLSRQD